MAQIATLLHETYPDAKVELDHRNAYELLVATILSAQSTDKLINTVTPALFEKFPNPTALAGADQPDLEVMVHKTGFFRMKAKHLLEMARACVERHGGEVPDTMEGLCALPGVARKTANVVLGCAMGKNVGVIVDTHVTRVSARLGLTEQTDPTKIEQDLMRLLPQESWCAIGTRLILHGRRVCTAKDPKHDQCVLAPLCPTAAMVQLAPTKQRTPSKKGPPPMKSKVKPKRSSARA
ncbi:MAG: endonuclease III [Myxococcota bacterium]|nr:endonuclease III [Myxococcota bacterium]